LEAVTSLATETGTKVTVMSALHNRTMERRFMVFRKGLAAEESSSGGAAPELPRELARAREDQGETSSKLGALLVVLAPFAVAAWVAIGLSVYRLVT
jgi:hypothetical protein